MIQHFYSLAAFSCHWLVSMSNLKVSNNGIGRFTWWTSFGSTQTGCGQWQSIKQPVCAKWWEAANGWNNSAKNYYLSKYGLSIVELIPPPLSLSVCTHTYSCILSDNMEQCCFLYLLVILLDLIFVMEYSVVMVTLDINHWQTCLVLL